MYIRGFLRGRSVFMKTKFMAKQVLKLARGWTIEETKLFS